MQNKITRNYKKYKILSRKRMLKNKFVLNIYINNCFDPRAKKHIQHWPVLNPPHNELGAWSFGRKIMVFFNRLCKF